MTTPFQTRETNKLPWAQLRLPPFSHVALRVLQLAGNENVQLHELSQLISSDPALASEILSIVNSPVYAPRVPITSILQAIAVMGANHLQGLCLMVAARGYMGKSLSDPAIQALWRHNLACAIIAEELAATCFIDRDSAFTCGVMHDVGRFALAAVQPRPYIELLAAHGGTPASILERERLLFGRDHCEIGKRLVVEWKLPEDFEPIVAHHHDAPSRAGNWGMSELINLSCRMADTAGFPAFARCERTEFTTLLEELPARERKLFHSEVEGLIGEVTARITQIEAL